MNDIPKLWLLHRPDRKSLDLLLLTGYSEGVYSFKHKKSGQHITVKSGALLFGVANRLLFPAIADAPGVNQ